MYEKCKSVKLVASGVLVSLLNKYFLKGLIKDILKTTQGQEVSKPAKQCEFIKHIKINYDYI